MSDQLPSGHCCAVGNSVERQAGKQQAGKHQTGNITGRLLPALVLGALAIALLIFETTRYAEINRLRDRTAALQDDVRDAQSKAEAALRGIIAPETLSAATKSVYLIVVNGKARGTAFVIDRDKGLLATAAHTADSLAINDKNANIYLLNRNSETKFSVTSKHLHAGFGTFRALVEDYQPIRKNSSVYAPEAAPLRDLAFDAALITVNPFDAETGENRLGPDLPIASEENLLALEAGAPIAVIGYPYDTLDDGFSPDAATSRVERGVIAALTPPLDSAAEHPDPVIANLIIHRLGTAGGNSGSPILNASGQVIGIHTHGIESPSSNADGAAQRAEVLYDLLSPEREQKRLSEIFLPAWRRTLTYWARAEDALSWSFYMEYARPGEIPAPKIDIVESVAAPPFQHSVEKLNFESPAESRKLEASDIKPATATADSAISAEQSAFVIREPGEFAEFWRTVDRSSEHVLFAFDYSLRSKIGFCPLTAYWRKKGDTRLQVVRGRASFELHLPALDGNTVEDYQILLRRKSGCDPISAEFITGAVSWPAPAKDNIQTVSFSPGDVEDSPASQRPVRPFAQTLAKFQKSWTRFSECRLRQTHSVERCAPPEYIELESDTGQQ